MMEFVLQNGYNQKALHLEQDDWNAPLDEWHEKRAFTKVSL
jgi:hypothetical protein